MSCSFHTAATKNSYKSTFNDGKRSVDFVLAYKNDSNLMKSEKRRVFQSNLKRKGLELEEDEPDVGLNLRFVKIHAPKDVCREYCEKLKLTMPTKKLEKSEFKCSPSSKWYDTVRRWFSCKIYYDHRLFPPTRQYEKTVYSKDEEHMFDVNAANFFTPTIRATIVQFILNRTSFSPNDTEAYDFGINQAYCAAYPLHEGDCDIRGSPRHALSCGWASLRNMFRYQPLDHIREYFGAEIALYFTWLGFYTYMLLLPAIIGSICFLYTWMSTKDCLSCKEICDSLYDRFNGSEPSQDLHYQCGYCWFWEIQDTCLGNSGQSLYLFKDCIAVLFTIFMLIWCTSFLELWKQYSTEVTRRWGVTAFDKRNEHPRPEYLAMLRHNSKRMENPITNDFEPEIPFWTRRLPIKLLTVSCTTILIFISVIGVEFSNLVSSWAISIMEVLYSSDDSFTYLRIGYGYYNLDNKVIHTMEACTKTVFIMIWNSICIWLVRYFANLGLHRTQNEYDDSLLRKLSVIHFINYYLCAIYIVFLRAKAFLGWSFGIFLHARIFNEFSKNYLLTEFLEVCGLDGCLSDLRVELTATMISKQAVNAMKITGCWWSGREILNAKRYRDQRKRISHFSLKSKQWISDYKLLTFGPQPMFLEYLEMVVQFGFVMLFAYAFPLAPLFALLNNIIEVRLDAKKMITFHRRPIPQPSLKQINIWHEILDSICYLAVITNSYIIAFNSDIIPKIVYSLKQSYNSTSYSQFSLNYINITLGDKMQYNNNTMFYPDMRFSLLNTNFEVWSKLDKEHIDFWICLTARLLFMVVFQNFMKLLLSLVRRYIRSRNTFYRSNTGVEEPRDANHRYKSVHQQQKIVQVQLKKYYAVLRPGPTVILDWDHNAPANNNERTRATRVAYAYALKGKKDRLHWARVVLVNDVSQPRTTGCNE